MDRHGHTDMFPLKTTVNFTLYTAVSTKVVQKSVKAYATMPKGSLGNNKFQ